MLSLPAGTQIKSILKNTKQNCKDGGLILRSPSHVMLPPFCFWFVFLSILRAQPSHYVISWAGVMFMYQTHCAQLSLLGIHVPRINCVVFNWLPLLLLCCIVVFGVAQVNTSRAIGPRDTSDCAAKVGSRRLYSECNSQDDKMDTRAEVRLSLSASPDSNTE